MRAAIRRDQAGDHVEHGGLAGAVRTQQPDRLAAADIDADAPHNLTASRNFFPRHARPGSRDASRSARGAVGGGARTGSFRPVALARGAPSRGRGTGGTSRGLPRAIGGASRTGLVSMSPMVSPSAVISACLRANPGGPRFGGRLRNTLKISTMAFRSVLSRSSARTPRRFDRIRRINMKRKVRCPAKHGGTQHPDSRPRFNPPAVDTD